MGKYKFINRKFPDDFQKVSDYIFYKRGIIVSLGDITKFLGHFNRQIIIHHNYDITNNGLFALLHECGRVLQPITNIGVNSYKNLEHIPEPLVGDIVKHKYLYEYRMGRFLSEVDAWKRGYQIAMDLGISINIKDWEREKNKSLITYFN